ncbi:C6 transcription factor, putative [Cordyceps militaris CM01]|uniref:C6 transcription factor, putative n=1 Tax=Cordyceps militaris (strain CM01) TaxID=983644 RepID=G3J598_CORMM|nr:C6 transcription factor, putative [Cordyceps militaris CM01]EGX96808.1 C6 transcription factor, putative [Cordyceps militaris CM01]
MANNKRRSCDVCYTRKIRCDAAKTGTTCDWCAHHNLKCTFTPRKPRVRSMRSYKCSVCQARPSPRQSRGFGQSNSRPNDIYPNQDFGFVCLLTGIPHFSDGCEEWVQMRSGLRPQFDFPSFQHCSLDDLSPLAASITKLPPRWAFDAMLDAFTKSDLSLIFPLVDEVLVEETANLVYATEGTPSLQHISAKACVMSLLIVVGLHFPEVKATKYVDIEAFSKASKLLIAECLEDTSLTTLQTYLLLSMHDMTAGRMQAAAMYNALACRAVFALRGHQRLFPCPKNQVLSIEEREDRHIRLLFWMCYYFDKDISLRTGHPPSIDDEFCDLTLPEGYNQARWCSRSRDPSNNTQAPFFPGDMALTMVKSKVARSLYGNNAWEKSEAQLIRTIRELDADLESWRSSIPREFAPQLSVRKDISIASDLSRCMTMLHLELHLEYHHVLMVIHGASGLSAAAHAPTGTILPGVQSSLELSVEASRSTLVYLMASANRVASEAFWAFIFYPMSALMTVFFSILRRPRGDHTLQDLELIGMTSSIVRVMPIHITVPFAKEYLRRVDVFVKELHRLAKGAHLTGRAKLNGCIGNVMCDRAPEGCSQCRRKGNECPGYPDPKALRMRNETTRRFIIIVITISININIIIIIISFLPRSSLGAPSSAMALGTEQQAVSFFFQTFITATPFDDYLSSFYTPDSPRDDACAYAIEATALAAYARHARQPAYALDTARRKYAGALIRVNAALADPCTAVRDRTLVAVLVLALFEATIFETGGGSSAPTSWVAHTWGAMQLLLLRGATRFASPTSRQLFAHASSNIKAGFIQRSTRIPPRFLALDEQFRGPLDGHEPAVRLTALMHVVSAIRAQACEEPRDHQALLIRALELDQEIFAFCEAPPTTLDFARETHCWGPAWTYRGIVHTYPSLRLCKYWNAVRLLRVFLLGLISDEAKHFGADGEGLADAQTRASLEAYAQRHLADVAADVLATVPSFVYMENGVRTFISPGRCLGLPLGVIEMTTHFPPDVRLYARKTLEWLAGDLNFPQAIDPERRPGRTEDR